MNCSLEMKSKIFNVWKIFYAGIWHLLNYILPEKITTDEVSKIIMSDVAYQNSIDAKNDPIFTNFQQSLLNKERQTQDVVIQLHDL